MLGSTILKLALVVWARLLLAHG